MKAINQRLIIYDPFSWFFSLKLMEKDQSKRFAWGHTYTETQAQGTTHTSAKPQNPSAAPPCNPREGRGIPKGVKGSSECFLCIPFFFPGDIITRETLKLKSSLHKTSKATVHSLFNPEGAFMQTVSFRVCSKL